MNPWVVVGYCWLTVAMTASGADYLPDSQRATSTDNDACQQCGDVHVGDCYPVKR